MASFSALRARLAPAPVTAVAALATLLSLLACSGPQDSTGVGNPGLIDSEEQALVTDGQDGSEGGDLASSLTAIPVFAIRRATEVTTPEAAATAALLSVDFFQPKVPASCVVATKTTPTQVAYTFTSPCSGPLGLATIDGKLTVDFSAAASGGVTFKIRSDAMTVGGVPVTHTATATVSFAGTLRTLLWDGTFSGTTARGLPVTHTASYTLVDDLSAGCLQLDGSSQTQIVRDGKTFGHKADVAGYVHCGKRATCPYGGTITLSRLPAGVPRVVVRYLGGPRADLTTARGKVASYPLQCE